MKALLYLSQTHPFKGFLRYPQLAPILLTLFCDPFTIVDCLWETFWWGLSRAVLISIAPQPRQWLQALVWEKVFVTETQPVNHRDLKINVTAPWHLVNVVNGITRLLVDLAFIRTCAVFAQSFDQLKEPSPDWSIRCVFRLLDVNHLVQYFSPTDIFLNQ
jgi:hypothetical protein